MKTTKPFPEFIEHFVYYRKHELGRLMLKSVTIIFLFAFAFPASSTAQCGYAQVTGNDTLVVAIPCDFPVYMNTGNAQVDMVNYENEVTVWNSQYPELMPILFVSGSFIRIPTADFNLFTTARQAAVIASPSYYQLLP